MDPAMQLAAPSAPAKTVGAGLSSAALGDLSVAVLAVEVGASSAILGAVVGGLFARTNGARIGAAVGGALGIMFGSYVGYEAKAAA